ncbi:MAG: hypothetical protein SynsKO_44680 [Synoicihabitans sp.]
MSEDLLLIDDLEPPMGDLSIGHQLDTARSVWTRRESSERSLPRRRIIHQRILRLHGPARLEKLGIRPARGFHKCASSHDRDWVVDFRMRARVEGKWQTVLERKGMKRPRSEDWRWLRLPRDLVADAVVIELRRSGLDGAWTSWNLATGGLALMGELLAPIGPRFERRLTMQTCAEGDLPKGITARRGDGTVRYETADFSVGFRLDRPGLSLLSLGTEAASLKESNLLLTNPVKCDQGPQLHPIGAAPRIAPSVRCDLAGTVRVSGPKVTYEIVSGAQHYTFRWEVRRSGLKLRVTREAKQSELMWHSSAWTLGWNNAVSPTHAVGTLVENGESGQMRLPVWVNAPGFGTWLIESDDPAAAIRSECRRHADLHQLELKVGEVAEPGGGYRLPAGRFEATFRLKPVRPPRPLKASAPQVVKRALERTYFVAPTFRADIATLANSGASMTCPICMDSWSAVLPQQDLRSISPHGPSGGELLRISIERWLAGGPGYAAGMLSHGGKIHDADDEYLMTGAAILRAIGDYLSICADRDWFRRHRRVILQKIAAAEARDLDGDGLIESPHRTGTRGSGQWSTCWLDVLSFGWKCAWSNAILYGALRELSAGFNRFGDRKTAGRLRDWAKRLKAAYRPTFWQSESGWLAGWRCRNDELHDYAFLPVNGQAVREGLLPAKEGRQVMQRLLAEMDRVGMPDPALGLPMNLWPIPDEDRADILQGYPFGYYQNGGRTHSQTRHFVMGLYHVGLTAEADRMLERLCVGFAAASTFGGNRTGVDWRAWDDTPCGYEGLLTDQFGLLEAILWRWGKKPSKSLLT